MASPLKSLLLSSSIQGLLVQDLSRLSNVCGCRAVLTSKSDPIGVWLVSATHQQPGDPGSASHPGISLEQPGSQPSMPHPSGSLKIEQHDYGMPGEDLSSIQSTQSSQLPVLLL